MKIKPIVHIPLMLALLGATALTVMGASTPATEKPAADPTPTLAAAPMGSAVTGSYLSGQFARSSGRYEDAIRYMTRVHLREPENMGVAVQLEGLLLLQGQIEEAAKLSEIIQKNKIKDPLADLLLTVRALKNNQPKEANAVLAAAQANGSNQLWVPLMTAWSEIGKGKLAKPLTVEQMRINVGNTAPLVNYHLALINARAGFKETANAQFKKAIDDPKDPSIRVMKMVLQYYDKNGKPEALQPIVAAYRKAAPDADANLPAMVETPQDGAAEVLYTMGGIMFGAGVSNDAAIYLQLATYLKPDFIEARLALADAFAEMHQYARASDEYMKIPAGHPLFVKAQIHAAVNLDHMGKLSESLALLDKNIKQPGDNPELLITKGDLLRIHNRYAEAIDAYTAALTQIKDVKPMHWPILFARGSCLEREGRWPEAERDLQQALVLKPDQPDVLNYLGYAWMERGENVEQARIMVEKAVKARPNDGQIVDSMGWALYLTGDYKNAAEYLDKAVELMPGDSTVNDHLGDVYWRLGRKTEARFQWERSLTFSPDAKLAAVIQKKLKDGLPPAAVPATTVSASSESKTPPTP